MVLSSSATWLHAILASATIALVARRARSLSPSGALAATAVGVFALRASWGWGALLIAWFVLGSALTHVGKVRKVARTGTIVAKGARRDLWQVLANGGVFALAAACVAFGWVSTAHAVYAAAFGVGALAAAAADTWGTEIGTLYGREPWSIRTRARVPAGTSGAVTLVGTVAMLGGALVTTLLAVALQVLPRSPRVVLVVTVAAASGALVDTMLGAWMQERRWCRMCGEFTERRIHRCGAATEQRGGVALVDNDVVNLACTVVGAVLAVAMTFLT